MPGAREPPKSDAAERETSGQIHEHDSNLPFGNPGDGAASWRIHFLTVRVVESRAGVVKRFTETAKWEDIWFRSLTGPQKLVFLYVCDRCDAAGFWERDDTMLIFQTGLSQKHVEGAWQGLSRGLIEAGGWVWVKNFLRHQRNEDLNPENRAHAAIIALLNAHRKRLGKHPEFETVWRRPSQGPPEGLTSPPVIVKSGNGQEKEGNPKGRFHKPTLDEAKAYGAEIGMKPAEVESWYDHFEANGWRVGGKALMIDWKAGLRNGKRMAPLISPGPNGHGKPADALRAHERPTKPALTTPTGFMPWLCERYPDRAPNFATQGQVIRDSLIKQWREETA